jgi:2-methylcitrate dehydratase
VLNIVDADDEEPTSARSVVYPLVAANCLLDVALARAGMGGVPRILEGNGGFAEVIGRGSWPVDGIRPDARCEGVLSVWVKPAVACVLGQGAAAALLELVAEGRISATDVDRVNVRVKPAALAHMGGEIRRFPTSKESADHSLYFLSAVGIRDGAIGPAQFTSSTYEDEQVKALIERVEVGVLDTNAGGSAAAAAVRIHTRDGILHERSIGIPPGHPERPFTDLDVERKLRLCALGRLTDAQQDHFLGAVGRLESIEDVGDLLRPLAFGT